MRKNGTKDLNMHFTKQNILIDNFILKSAQFHYLSEKYKSNPQ